MSDQPIKNLLDKPMSALARLFRRGGGGVAAFAYSHALNQPLMVEPTIGGNMLRGYMSGDAEGAGSVTLTQETVVAVIDIKGVLLSREEIGPCGEVPPSYEGIGRMFDRLMADESVTAIVLRLNSPGGMANGLFDLTDKIYAARGKKRTIAVIDDNAFSACYGIAAACEEIWISRTGGAGSVGVVSYHINQAGWLEKIGVAVEYLFAGEHKIDGNPNSALSEPARIAFQAEVDRLYGLFTSSTAKYLGVAEEVIRATEAALYFGEKAIEAGLAHKLGTFQDALASLSIPPVATPPGAGGDAGGAQASSERIEPKLGVDVPEAAAVAATVTAASAEAPGAAAEPTLQELALEAESAGFPELCLVFMKEGMSASSARSRLDTAIEIKNLCAAAGAPHLASKFALEGRDTEWVRGQLASARVREDDQDILSLQPSDSGAAAKSGKTINRAEIFARRNTSTRK